MNHIIKMKICKWIQKLVQRILFFFFFKYTMSSEIFYKHVRHIQYLKINYISLSF